MRYNEILFDTDLAIDPEITRELGARGIPHRTADAAGGNGALFVSADGGKIDGAARRGQACALALWTSVPRRHARADHYLRAPYDLIALLDRREDAFDGLEWVRTAMEMQFIAQAGLAYSRDVYDIERFERLRTLSVEMLARGCGLPSGAVRDVFCAESGYQTPKMDTRAAVFDGGRILLVEDRDGRWALPGGWIDVDQTVAENTAKEVLEEAGLSVIPRRLIALQEHNLHNRPTCAHGVCKVFVLCERVGGEFRENIETVASGFFAQDALPPLCEGKTTAEQVRMCFAANADPAWQPIFD